MGWLEDERVRWILASILILGGILLVHGESIGYIFSSEDWVVVGPPAVQRFLEHPLGIFEFLSGGHFNPIGRLFFTLESLLFRQHPLGYHLVSLALLAALSLFLLGCLRSFGVGFLAALLATLCFALNWVNCLPLVQVYNQHYFILGILLLACLLLFRRYLARGSARDLVFTAVLVGAAQYVHSTAVILPVILLLLTPFRWEAGGEALGRSEGKGRPKKALALLLLAGVVVVLQGLPRLIQGAHLEGVGAAPSLNIPGFVETLGYALGWSGAIISQGLPTWAAWALAALLAAAVVAGLRQRRLIPLLVLGLGVMVLTVVPAFFTLNWEPGFFASRPRYLFLPSLGGSLAGAVFLQGLAGARGRWLAAAGRAAAAGLAVLYLAGSITAIGGYYEVFRPQARFVETVVDRYLRTAKSFYKVAPCPKLIFHDVPLFMTQGQDLRGGVLIQGLNHKIIHGFYFALDPGMMNWYEFRGPNQIPGEGGDPCVFMLVDGFARRAANWSGE